MNITHYFSSGTYCKETRMEAGEWGDKHVHDHDHLSVLCDGIARLTVDGETRTIQGPAVLTIEATRVHRVLAVTALTWLCIHATDETDPDKIDSALVHEER